LSIQRPASVFMTTEQDSLPFLSISPPHRPTLFPYTTLFRSLYTTLTKASQAESVEMVIERILEFYIPVLKTIEENWRERSEDFRSEEHTSELQSRENLVCRLLLEKKITTRIACRQT